MCIDQEILWRMALSNLAWITMKDYSVTIMGGRCWAVWLLSHRQWRVVQHVWVVRHSLKSAASNGWWQALRWALIAESAKVCRVVSVPLYRLNTTMSYPRKIPQSCHNTLHLLIRNKEIADVQCGRTSCTTCTCRCKSRECAGAETEDLTCSICIVGWRWRSQQPLITPRIIILTDWFCQAWNYRIDCPIDWELCIFKFSTQPDSIECHSDSDESMQ
jgi:hypothetical protein